MNKKDIKDILNKPITECNCEICKSICRQRPC